MIRARRGAEGLNAKEQASKSAPKHAAVDAKCSRSKATHGLPWSPDLRSPAQPAEKANASAPRSKTQPAAASSGALRTTTFVGINGRALTSKVTGDRGAGEAPPAGVRVDRWVRRQYADADHTAGRSGRRESAGLAALQGGRLWMKHAKAASSRRGPLKTHRPVGVPRLSFV